MEEPVDQKNSTFLRTQLDNKTPNHNKLKVGKRPNMAVQVVQSDSKAS